MPPKKTVTRKIEQERSLKKENSELKQELRHLKKQVARLRKQLAKNIERGDGASLPEESPSVAEPPDTKSEPEEIDNTPKCLACGSFNLVSFPTPGGRNIVGCRDCKSRF